MATGWSPASFHAGEGAPLVGNAARQMLIDDPQRTVYSVKRLMGRGLARRRTKS